MFGVVVLGFFAGFLGVFFLVDAVWVFLFVCFYFCPGTINTLLYTFVECVSIETLINTINVYS